MFKENFGPDSDYIASQEPRLSQSSWVREEFVQKDPHFQECHFVWPSVTGREKGRANEAGTRPSFEGAPLDTGDKALSRVRPESDPPRAFSFPGIILTCLLAKSNSRLLPINFVGSSESELDLASSFVVIYWTDWESTTLDEPSSAVVWCLADISVVQVTGGTRTSGARDGSQRHTAGYVTTLFPRLDWLVELRSTLIGHWY
ncbi:hypothetical protein BS47DRAFT_533392 [Hydnum rufescens UP504]|uniref:Uncharacterized protein n=1 Tax=Hydnum rufescens UP504 TaxID=1448309 RepID=A0A9P6E052_9AGAM|nr:hypothetical protein BS47DRAFT_533392 [Hydnum rufescens UP504]